ncbi:MAG TPA: NADH-quinone oxidoreductase subunit N [Vicinamibacterales bacterium]|nr:NADH-quinone oxidoreductase subunit N [Vicinamibacterales bacterium]
MTSGVFVLLGPLIAVATTIIVLMMTVAIHRRPRLTAVLTLAGLGIAFLLLFWTTTLDSRRVTALLVIDDYARFYTGLILAATAAVTLLSVGYLERLSEQRDEYYMLLLLGALGSIVLVSAVHFMSLFLGLELLSVSLYALIAYPRSRQQSIEAGLKYLVLAAASAAFLLFGMALVYAEVGSMAFSQVVAPVAPGARLAWLVGIGLIVVGFGFKLALVPFHLWTPDVYEGAPAPTTAFVATVSKGAMLAVLLRLFSEVDGRGHHALFLGFTVLATASMVGGNFLALLQRNVKRLLAYSSIAHLGYLLVAFLASGALAETAIAFYLVAYFVTMIGAFGVVAVLSTGEHDADSLDDYRGLAVRRPWLSAVFTAMLLSLAGIPLTAGFVGKFFLTVAGGGAALWPLLAVMMVTSGIGLFYYLRVIVAMYMQPVSESTAAAGTARVPLVAGLTLAALTILLVWLGVYPGPLIAFIRSAVSGGA